YTSEQAIRDALVEQLRQGHRQGRKSIVVGHHPLDSEGSHGGHFDFDHHLFPLRMVAAYVPFYMEWLPLPIMGTAIMQYRACCSPSAQDMSHRRNEHMRAALSVAMAKAEREGYGPLLFAAGHDHTLQVFKGERGPKYTAVSGLGSSHKASPVGSNRRTLFAHSNPFRPGLMMVDFHRDGSVRLSVIQKTGDAEEGEETFTMLLTDPPGGGDSKAVVGGR
ncbi:MAG TPA: hypothetical protein VEB21_15150, partial [Terriglobales bacterium]|nr:hypothetical protein [Terriglobales bacterium]